MPTGICPNCSYALAELVDREIRDDEVYLRFECGECGTTWSQSML